MQTLTGDLWTEPADWRCITTNGYVNNRGECTMGRGCALEAKLRFPLLPNQLGNHIAYNGNVPHLWWDYHLISFPVKHVWWQRADLKLIAESAAWLREIALSQPDARILLPRPGCGNGKLTWAEVEPILRDLPDNVFVISK